MLECPKVGIGERMVCAPFDGLVICPGVYSLTYVLETDKSGLMTQQLSAQCSKK